MPQSQERGKRKTAMIGISLRSTILRRLPIVLWIFLISTTKALRGNSWQKRIDRAFLQVDGITPQGRFRSFQRALGDPELRTDVSNAIKVIQEKGFGKGHPEFIELLWPEGTQARRDLEAINALTKQLTERRDEVQNSNSGSQGVTDIIRSSQENLRFGKEGSLAVVSSLLEQIQSDPNRAQRLASNVLRNFPLELESPSYELLGKYSEGVGEKVDSESDGEEESTEKKSFLTIPELELRRYDAFRSVSVPLPNPGSSSFQDGFYTLKNMGPALTEIFSYLELGDNAGSTLMSMTTPFFISDAATDGTNKMFVKLPQDQESNPPESVGSSCVAFDDIPEKVMATLPFPGICTNEEIKRQKAKLMTRIETAGEIGWKVKTGDLKEDNTEEHNVKESNHEFFVLQYNAPGTLPWRRLNEIAVIMEKTNIEVISEAKVESDQKKAETTLDEEDDIETSANEAEVKIDQKKTESTLDEEDVIETEANNNEEISSTTDADDE